MITGSRWTMMVCVVAAALWHAPSAGADELSFVQNVDLEKIRLIAVQHDGRFKTFDTLAREIVRHITGRTFYEREVTTGENDAAGTTRVEQDPVFTYLDLLFNSQAYLDRRVIQVKKKEIRSSLLRAAGDSITESERAAIMEDGLVSLRFLVQPAVRTRLDALSRDLMTTAKQVDQLYDAASLTDPTALSRLLRIIPPPEATSGQERWFAVSALSPSAPRDVTHAGIGGGEEIPGMSEGRQQELAAKWQEIGVAWRGGEADAATKALNDFAAVLPTINTNPAVYPPADKLALEHWYYRHHKMTWAWIFYMMAIVLLLMAIVYRWRWALVAGVGVFGLSFALHTVATGIRWYLAGRIPNSNMFEAVTAAAWFGCAIAIFFELGPLVVRKRLVWQLATVLAIGSAVVFVASLLVRGVPFHAWRQWGPWPTTSLILFAVGSMALIALATARRFHAHGLALLAGSAGAMVALMCGRFMTVSLNSDISNRMPVLNDVWLYIHTNMIIASYALIGMAFITAGMYVVGRLLTRPTTSLWAAMLIPAALIPAFSLIPGISVQMVMPAWSPFLIVLAATCVASLVRLVGGRFVGQRSFAAWEGLPLGVSGVVNAVGRSPAGADAVAVPVAMRQRGGLAQVLDGATMLLMELSFITLWTGIIMGAIWADHSWGRPWGWDPKEVFALNTWIIFLILVHVRMKVRDKALWTAVLAVIGCSVMLFNWIVVNFFITGLHSYA